MPVVPAAPGVLSGRGSDGVGDGPAGAEELRSSPAEGEWSRVDCHERGRLSSAQAAAQRIDGKELRKHDELVDCPPPRAG